MFRDLYHLNASSKKIKHVSFIIEPKIICLRDYQARLTNLNLTNFSNVILTKNNNQGEERGVSSSKLLPTHNTPSGALKPVLC